MDYDQLARDVANIDTEAVGAALVRFEDERNDKCAKGDHQGFLTSPAVFGHDTWWVCSHCKRRVRDVGGNAPVSL